MGLPPCLRVLLVEDEALLAMDVAQMLEEEGHAVVGEAASLDETVALPGGLDPHLALVDVQLLGGSSGLDAACALRGRYADLVIVFVTANPGKVPAGHAAAVGILPKPFTRAAFVATIRHVASAPGQKEAAPPPGSFIPMNGRAG